MTREEAISILEEEAEFLYQDDRPYNREAFDMAIEALSAEPQNCWNCKHYEPKHDVCHAPKLVKQVTSKLKKHCDSLLTDDKDDSKEHKSKLDGDLISRADAMAEFREWVKRANENGETPTWNDAVSLIGSLPSADAVQWMPMPKPYKESE